VPRDLFARLASRQLLVVTGKGGVGKTALTACLGRGLARRGRRTLVFEVDPRENLHQMLGVPPSGGDITDAGGGLYLQNLKPREVVDAIVRERLKLEMVTRRILDSPVYQHFAEGAPGLKEVAILGHALRLIRGAGPRRGELFDTVVLDAPATGHGVTLLAAPRLLSEVIEKGPIGHMGQELAEFVADADRCGVVVVTAAEEMPVEEALELRQSLRERLSREPELLVVNGLYPPAPRQLDGAADPWVDLWRRRRRLNEAELERLEAGWEGPRVELPQFPLDRGPELVEALRRCLETELARVGVREAAV
jgi:anion-transporting  ArsA/GET3 family ATPase